MDKNCCGNCKHWDSTRKWCKKHDGAMSYGTLCTGWEDKNYVMECGVCEEIFCKSDEAFHIDDTRVCESCFAESAALKDDEVNHPQNEMLEAIETQCKMMADTLKTKNTDYGNSFERTMNKYGDVALMLRLEDKFNRLESLFSKKEVLVKDESFDDTLKDLAGYCLLYLAIKER